MVLPVPVPGIDILVNSMNSNPYFIGVMMLILNLGGRFLSLEVSKGQEKFLSDPMIRRFLLFVVLFVGTRNVIVAAGMTVVIVILLGYLLNENSDLYIFHSTATKKPEKVADASSFGLSMEEMMILKRLQDKQAEAQKKPTSETTKESPTQGPSAFDYYISSIQRISA
jgi:hypothetical protein